MNSPRTTRVQPTAKKTREYRNELLLTGYAAVFNALNSPRGCLKRLAYVTWPPTRGSDFAARPDQVSSLFPGFYGTRSRFFFSLVENGT